MQTSCSDHSSSHATHGSITVTQRAEVHTKMFLIITFTVGFILGCQHNASQCMIIQSSAVTCGERLSAQSLCYLLKSKKDEKLHFEGTTLMSRNLFGRAQRLLANSHLRGDGRESLLWDTNKCRAVFNFIFNIFPCISLIVWTPAGQGTSLDSHLCASGQSCCWWSSGCRGCKSTSD